MSVLDLESWNKVSYKARPDAEITMELRRLKRHEARPLKRVLIACFAETEKAQNDDLTNAQKAAIIDQVFDLVPEEELKGWFSGAIRNVGNFRVDGQPVTTGDALLEHADDGLILWVLLTLRDISQLTVKEGKDSRSASRSPSLPAQSGSDSPATSTESAGGPPPSDVTGQENASSSESPDSMVVPV